MTSKILKYNLNNFNDITFNGFNLELPPEVIKIISEISLEVGSPNYVKTPIFKKRVNPLKDDSIKSFDKDKDQNNTSNKKRKNKAIEVFDDEWESIRNFQTTKIEQKNGIEVQIDNIRSHLNKMTDKNYLDILEKITILIDEIIVENNEEIMRVGNIIFEIASTNRFYSKIYADLYSHLINKYEVMRTVFENSFNKFLELFNLIEYVDSSVDYDKFCKINKDNEKRKALSSFFINLMNNKIITKEMIYNIVYKLFEQISDYILQENKKNEVDEITENIAILYKKELFDNNTYVVNKPDSIFKGLNINQIIEKLANSKIKTYPSLTNKSIFKFMDMIDM